MKYLFACALVSAFLQGLSVSAVDYEDYDYGDINIEFDSVHKGVAEPVTQRGSFFNLDLPLVPQALRGARNTLVSKTTLPLCCPEGQISEFQHCAAAPLSYSWKPRLDGASSDISFEYKGWPKCRNQGNKISFYQLDVHFNGDEVILPFHVQLESIKPEGYCITKVSQDEVSGCETFQTQIYACINENSSTPTIVWASVTVSHILILLTLLVFFCMRSYKSLQGQYMICFLISLLAYNLCLFPGSSASMNVSDVVCIAIGAIKYFFFCGIFLWFSVICFDTCRSIQKRQDQSCRRRFLLSSAFCWILGAILTTVVLVMPYTSQSMSENSRNDPLRETNYEVCKLKMGVDIILQIAQSMCVLVDLILLSVATYCMKGYTKFGNGMQRCDASNSLKLSWKLFFIMVAHLLSCVDTNFLKLPIPMWQFVLIESMAVFGVFAYRRSVLRWVGCSAGFKRFLNSDPSTAEDDNQQEKGQLTLT